jgi:uncharacterized protein (TIGR03067 family)
MVVYLPCNLTYPEEILLLFALTIASPRYKQMAVSQRNGDVFVPIPRTRLANAPILRFRLAFDQTGLQSFGINMKARLLMITGLGLLLAACGHQAPAPASAPKTDLDRLQGTWNLTSAMQDGKPLAEDKVKQTTIVFKGDTFRFPGSAEYATSKEGTIKLDESKTPKEMDAISTEKEVMLGIYRLEENGYKVCFAPAGKPRPTEITSTPGSGYILQSWQRQNAQ